MLLTKRIGSKGKYNNRLSSRKELILINWLELHAKCGLLSHPSNRYQTFDES